MKKIVSMLLALVFMISLITGCSSPSSSDSSSEKKKLAIEDLTAATPEELAKKYLDNILEVDFKVVATATMTMTPADKDEFYAAVKNNIITPSSAIADTKENEKYIYDRLDSFYKEISYKITGVSNNGDKTIVEFVLFAPDVGYLSMIPYAYESDSIDKSNKKQAFIDAFNMVVGTTADAHSPARVRGTLQITEKNNKLSITGIGYYRER